MYEKVALPQRLGLIYGFKLRIIGAIEGNIGQAKARWHEFDIFTEEELYTIQTITQNAKDRARKDYNDARAKLPPKGLGK
jgi:hypothetical protein